MQISRIRLSDKTSRLHLRHVVPKRSQADEPEVPKHKVSRRKAGPIHSHLSTPKSGSETAILAGAGHGGRSHCERQTEVHWRPRLTPLFRPSWCINRRADGGLELPLKMVQARLGHASIQMTADRYGHLFPRSDDGAELAAAEKAFFG
jgi:integrase